LRLVHCIVDKSEADDYRRREVHIFRDDVTNRKRVNQYAVVDDINHGVHGKVKLAYNTRNGAKVAIKVLRRTTRRQDATEAIRREVNVLKRVHHANVITAFEVIDDTNHPKVYLVLEYAELGRLLWRKEAEEGICYQEWNRVQNAMKEELSAMLEKYEPRAVGLNGLSVVNRPLALSPQLQTSEPSSELAEPILLRRDPPPYAAANFDAGPEVSDVAPFTEHFHFVPCVTMEQARCVISDVVSGLECLHAHGVIHRDIKPDNLLWTKEYRIKIADFSSSFVGPSFHSGQSGGHFALPNEDMTAFDGEGEMYKTVGTPGFIAPELCCMNVNDMSAETLKQVDVWSLGATLYCLLFARLPFIADNEYQLYRKMAVQNVYIPRWRLRAVPPAMELPHGLSFWGRQYRREDVVEYERVSDDLIDLLQRMLARNPHQRLRLADIKKHPWLVQSPLRRPCLRLPQDLVEKGVTELASVS
jgi:serine/threonine protein kinase